MKIINIVGTRPNFMKIAPIIKEMNKFPELDHILLHTGQHYDDRLSNNFFKELGIPTPDVNLNIGSDTHAKQVARIMTAFEDVCDEYRPDLINVVGDVNSTMACTLVAAKKNIRIAHVEAGIRSFDRNMPEEINRLVTDSIADYLLPPSKDAVENLLKENHDLSRIEMVGNVMIDTLLNFQDEIQASDVLGRLGLKSGEYATLTMHRPSNVDNKEIFLGILEAVEHIQKDLAIVFPIHPRTRKMIEKFDLMPFIESMKNLQLVKPLGYFDFGKLVAQSKFVMTDSGGIQEETTVYKIPCITIRENTERPITLTVGSNKLAGRRKEVILQFAQDILNGNWKESSVPELWDGKTAERIVNFFNKLR